MATLGEIKALLSQRGAMPLMDMAHHFNKEPQLIRDRLDHWLKKGKVRRKNGPAACQSHCGGCGSGPVEWYEWVEQGEAVPHSGQTAIPMAIEERGDS